jgi:hypothetical protein
VFERYGIPLETMDERLVNGRLCTRLTPIVGADHAAVMAREAGIPAVVGVAGALDAVADGSRARGGSGGGPHPRCRVATPA